jgi:hypothetical protein
MSHGKQYPPSITPWDSQFVMGALQVSLQLAGGLYIYIHYALKKNNGSGSKHNCTQAGKLTVVKVY